MFQTPTQLGYQYMLLPTQARQQFVQQGGGTPPAMQPPNPLSGTNPQMAQAQNMMAIQAQQKNDQANNPMAQAQTVMGQMNKMQQQPQSGPNPLSGPAGLQVAPGMYGSQAALEAANGPLYATPYQAEHGGNWLQRNLGIGQNQGGSGGFFSNLLGDGSSDWLSHLFSGGSGF